MKKISSGERKARVLPDRKMPEEIQVIARQLNDTMDQLQDSMEQERIAKENILYDKNRATVEKLLYL